MRDNMIWEYVIRMRESVRDGNMRWEYEMRISGRETMKKYKTGICVENIR